VDLRVRYEGWFAKQPTYRIVLRADLQSRPHRHGKTRAILALKKKVMKSVISSPYEEFPIKFVKFNVNLRTDPFEQATITSNTYWDWYIDHAWVMYPLGDVVGGFLKTFKDYPPRMKAGSWDMAKTLEKLQTPHNK
jgi:hypothetical protein